MRAPGRNEHPGSNNSGRKGLQHRETPEEKQAKAADRQTRNTARILLAATVPDSEKRERQLRRLAAEGKSRPRTQPTLGKNQRAYCKEEGHWARECPKKTKKGPQKTPSWPSES